VPGRSASERDSKKHSISYRGRLFYTQAKQVPENGNLPSPQPVCRPTALLLDLHPPFSAPPAVPVFRAFRAHLHVARLAAGRRARERTGRGRRQIGKHIEPRGVHRLLTGAGGTARPRPWCRRGWNRAAEPAVHRPLEAVAPAGADAEQRRVDAERARLAGAHERARGGLQRRVPRERRGERGRVHERRQRGRVQVRRRVRRARRRVRARRGRGEVRGGRVEVRGRVLRRRREERGEAEVEVLGGGVRRGGVGRSRCVCPAEAEVEAEAQQAEFVLRPAWRHAGAGGRHRLRSRRHAGEGRGRRDGGRAGERDAVGAGAAVPA
jgi:hypothetical protein